MSASVAVTRTADDQASIAEPLRRAGFQVMEVPAIEIRRDDAAIHRGMSLVPEADWVVFTSAHGVRAIPALMDAAAALATRGLAAIGPATREALRAIHLSTSFMPSPFTAAALAEQLPDVETRAILLLRARKGNPELASTLRRRGAQVHDVSTYDTVPAWTLPGQAAALAENPPTWMCFTSPST
ncbi:MAG: uroporphyrinogen-III synthase, partial [Halobacteriales archaeon]|nr:uroporphyrinogen-III synthase [Halobacteriales archaeon]